VTSNAVECDMTNWAGRAGERKALRYLGGDTAFGTRYEREHGSSLRRPDCHSRGRQADRAGPILMTLPVDKHLYA